MEDNTQRMENLSVFQVQAHWKIFAKPNWQNRICMASETKKMFHVRLQPAEHNGDHDGQDPTNWFDPPWSEEKHERGEDEAETTRQWGSTWHQHRMDHSIFKMTSHLTSAREQEEWHQP